MSPRSPRDVEDPAFDQFVHKFKKFVRRQDLDSFWNRKAYIWLDRILALSVAWNAISFILLFIFVDFSIDDSESLLDMVLLISILCSYLAAMIISAIQIGYILLIYYQSNKILQRIFRITRKFAHGIILFIAGLVAAQQIARHTGRQWTEFYFAMSILSTLAAVWIVSILVIVIISPIIIALGSEILVRLPIWLITRRWMPIIIVVATSVILRNSLTMWEYFLALMAIFACGGVLWRLAGKDWWAQRLGTIAKSWQYFRTINTRLDQWFDKRKYAMEWEELKFQLILTWMLAAFLFTGGPLLVNRGVPALVVWSEFTINARAGPASSTPICAAEPLSAHVKVLGNNRAIVAPNQPWLDPWSDGFKEISCKQD